MTLDDTSVVRGPAGFKPPDGRERIPSRGRATGGSGSKEAVSIQTPPHTSQLHPRRDGKSMRRPHLGEQEDLSTAGLYQPMLAVLGHLTLSKIIPTHLHKELMEKHAGISWRSPAVPRKPGEPSGVTSVAPKCQASNPPQSITEFISDQWQKNKQTKRTVC